MGVHSIFIQYNTPPNLINTPATPTMTVVINWRVVSGVTGYEIARRRRNSTQFSNSWKSDETINTPGPTMGLTHTSLHECRIITDCGGTWSDTSKVSKAIVYNL